MTLSAWLKILLAALVATRVDVLGKRTLFRRFRHDRCPASKLMDFDDGAINVNVCVLRCRAMAMCSGVCYRKQDRMCRFFSNMPIASALNAAEEAPSYIMWWRDYPKNGSLLAKKYVLLTGTHTWNSDKLMCGAIGGTLPIPESVEENQYIASVTNNTIWLAMTDRLEEDSFLSPYDGSAIKYFNWRNGQPNDLDNQDCAQTAAEFWYDIDCNEKRLCCVPST